MMSGNRIGESLRPREPRSRPARFAAEITLARSSTTFGPGNTAGAQPGNKLARRHGAYDMAVIEERLPAIRERVSVELEQVGYLTPPDGSLVRTYCYVTAQVELLQEFFDANGGMFTTRGAPKRGASFLLLLVHRQQELAKVLGLGPVPRAQMAQAMAGAGKDAMVIKAAQDRLRERYLTN